MIEFTDNQKPYIIHHTTLFYNYQPKIKATNNVNLIMHIKVTFFQVIEIHTIVHTCNPTDWNDNYFFREVNNQIWSPIYKYNIYDYGFKSVSIGESYGLIIKWVYIWIFYLNVSGLVGLPLDI